MLSSEARAPGFRLFRSRQGNVAYADLDSDSLIEVTKYYPFILVSIMNTHFTYDASMGYMLRSAYSVFCERTATPLTSFCPYELQYITDRYLFKQEDGSHTEVDKRKDKWVNSYNKLISQEKSQHSSLVAHLLYGQIFKEFPVFDQIKNFLQVVFNYSFLLLDKDAVAQSFPSLFSNDTHGDIFLGKISDLHLADAVRQIARGFSSKNLTKLQAKADEARKKIEERRQFLDETGLSSIADFSQNKDINILEQAKEGLENATQGYLCEEYTYLLCLSLLDCSAELRRQVDIPSVSEESCVPLLIYPIDDKEGAWLIFKTFQDVEAFYREYAGMLNLPIANHALPIADIHIPEQYRPVRQAAKKSELLLRSSSAIFPVFSDQDKMVNNIVCLLEDLLEAIDEQFSETILMQYKNGIDCRIEVTKVSLSQEELVASGSKKEQKVRIVNRAREVLRKVVAALKDPESEIEKMVKYIQFGLYSVELEMTTRQDCALKLGSS